VEDALGCDGSKWTAVIAWIFVFLGLWAAAALSTRYITHIMGGCGACGSKSNALNTKGGRGGVAVAPFHFQPGPDLSRKESYRGAANGREE
jgi:hypothetical protein